MGSIRRLFAESPKDFRPVPWWAWTGDVTEEGMDKQILMMREQGIYEFFIFAIYGLDVEFNSDAYFDMVSYTLQRCRELGMKCWIYDDFNWPSGVGGGKVLRDHPWTRYKILEYKIGQVGPFEDVEIAIKGEFVRAFFVGPSGVTTPLDRISASVADGGSVLHWYNDTDDVGQVLAFSTARWKGLLPSAAGATWTWNQPGYLDVMNPDAVRVFIEYCYAPYAERFTEYLGKELRGFFADEPGLYGLMVSGGPNTFPYTVNLWSIFRERYGYSLEERLPELVIESGNWQVTRSDYWRLISDLFAKNFIGQINDWCVRHGTDFTGHFAGEDNIRWSMRYSGSIHRAARLMVTPGIDLLGELSPYDVYAPGRKSLYKTGIRALNITAKRISSVADYTDAGRRLAEAYGVVDWDQSLARMKRLVDWLTGMGLNLINDNTLIYSLQGFRKRRVSGKNFTTPWFPYYGRFSEHVGRVCWMTTVGHSVEEVGVLYPNISAWVLYGGMLAGSIEEETWPMMEEALLETCDALNRIHRGYKFLFDEELAEAQIEEGKLVVSGFPFTTVILPGVAALNRPVCNKLIAFARAGGRVLIVGTKPFLTPDPHWNVAEAVDTLLEQEQVEYLPDPVWREAYEAWLAEHIEAPVLEIAGPGSRDVLSAYRRDDTYHYLFISNQAEQPAQICVSSRLEGTWELWDPDTGKQWQLDTQDRGEIRYWEGQLTPFESVFVVVGCDGAMRPNLKETSLAEQRVLERKLLIGPWEFERLNPNMVLLDFSIQADPNCEGMNKGWQYGKGGIWTPTAAGRTEIELNPDKLAHFWLKAEIESTHIPADLELVVDSRGYGEVFVNGFPLTGGRETSIWDDGNWAYPLREAVFRGRNTVVMRCRPSKYYAERVRGNIIDPYYVEPAVIRGSFRAFRHGSECFTVMPETGEIGLGPWEEQGYPAFCGSAIYRKIVELSEIEGRYWLVLEDVRQVAEVEVNGRSVGAKLWQPYTFDITEMLRAGTNELAIRVTNSFGRLIRYSYTGLIAHEVLSGVIGRVWLVKTVL